MDANVVESNQASRADQAGIHFKVRLNTFVGMVAIDEKKIHFSIARQDTLQVREHFGLVRITTQQVQFLGPMRETSINVSLPVRIAATMDSTGEVDAYDGSRWVR